MSNYTTTIKTHPIVYPTLLSTRLDSFTYLFSFLTLLLLSFSTTSFGQTTGKNYQHWSDVDNAWNNNILNDAKSNYFEGEVIPHVYLIESSPNTPLVQGSSYSFTIVYNYYQQNTKAGGFAFATTYNIDRTTTGLSGPQPTMDNNFTDPSNGMQGDFYTINANITGVTGPVKSGSGTFDNTITVTFTYTGSTGGAAEIYFGLYVAEPGQVADQGNGPTDGASAWSGGSLQTTVNSSFTGALSLQLAPAAIIRGTISGLKYRDRSNDGVRDVNTEEGLSGWTIYLDTDNDGILDEGEESTITDVNGNFSFSVTPGTYYIREINQTNWTQTQPAAGFYGPIIISAADPVETGLMFGNFICVSPTVTPGSYGPVCIDAAAITLGGTPSGGTWSGTGVRVKQGGGYEFVPVTAGAGTHELTYSVAATTTACSNSNTTSIVVNPLATVTPGSYGPVCINATAITLGGDPSGGTWIGTGVQAKQGGGYEFNPATAGEGTHQLTYSVGATSSTCANSNTSSVIVKPLATVTPGTFNPVCIDAAAVTLGGTPSGGTWTGMGVQAKQGGGYEFNPTTAGVGTHTLTYAVGSTGSACANSNTTSITVNGKPSVLVNSVTVCEGENATLTASGANSYSWNPSTTLSAASGTTVTASPNGTTTYTVTGTDANNCTNTANSTVTVNKCSGLQLEKLTNGLVDPTKSWQFTISGGDLVNPVQESVSGQSDGILFENVVLSKNQTYTICETNVPAGYSITLQYRDANGNWQNITAYDPNTINGGGDFNQGEANGNYCFTIGVGTNIAIPGNTFGSSSPVSLRIKINNIPPPMGNARTPGYWKNWNTCTGGNQVATAAKNGGSANGFWLMDNHLPHTLWAKTTLGVVTSSFVITSCNQGVLILDERQNAGNNPKMSSDAGYKLAKHLFAYQLNKKSGTYDCPSTALAATRAEALLAKYGFNGMGSVYLSSKDKAKKADYDLALQLAKTLDAYNNNLPCSSATLNTITSSKVEAPTEIDVEADGLMITTTPNPYRDRIRLNFESKTSGQGSLEVYNIMGQKVTTLYQGHIQAGQKRQIDYVVPMSNRTDLIYVLRVGDKLTTGKVLKQQ